MDKMTSVIIQNVHFKEDGFSYAWNDICFQFDCFLQCHVFGEDFDSNHNISNFLECLQQIFIKSNQTIIVNEGISNG